MGSACGPAVLCHAGRGDRAAHERAEKASHSHTCSVAACWVPRPCSCFEGVPATLYIYIYLVPASTLLPVEPGGKVRPQRCRRCQFGSASTIRPSIRNDPPLLCTQNNNGKAERIAATTATAPDLPPTQSLPPQGSAATAHTSKQAVLTPSCRPPGPPGPPLASPGAP